jgi:hypothetical protein
MQILQGTGIDAAKRRERRLSANCAWIRMLKYDWTKGRKEVLRLEEVLDKDAICLTFCSN